jgi:hypothetical protein
MSKLWPLKYAPAAKQQLHFLRYTMKWALIFFSSTGAEVPFLLLPRVRRFAAGKELGAQPEDHDESPGCRLFAGRGDTRNVLRVRQKVRLGAVMEAQAG